MPDWLQAERDVRLPDIEPLLDDEQGQGGDWEKFEWTRRRVRARKVDLWFVQEEDESRKLVGCMCTCGGPIFRGMPCRHVWAAAQSGGFVLLGPTVVSPQWAVESAKSSPPPVSSLPPPPATAAPWRGEEEAWSDGGSGGGEDTEGEAVALFALPEALHVVEAMAKDIVRVRAVLVMAAC